MSTIQRSASQAELLKLSDRCACFDVTSEEIIVGQVANLHFCILNSNDGVARIESSAYPAMSVLGLLQFAVPVVVVTAYLCEKNCSVYKNVCKDDTVVRDTKLQRFLSGNIMELI